jgi:hypothetical protein
MQAGLIAFAVAVLFISDWWERMFWFMIFLATLLPQLMEISSARDPELAGETEEFSEAEPHGDEASIEGVLPRIGAQPA